MMCEECVLLNGDEVESEVSGDIVDGMFVFFFQAEDGIRCLVRSRGLGDVYKRQAHELTLAMSWVFDSRTVSTIRSLLARSELPVSVTCLLYTSDAADDLLCVNIGGRRIIKKKKEKIWNACVIQLLSVLCMLVSLVV